MTISFEERPSDSPLIEQIWRSSSTTSGPFISTANVYWMMVVCREPGQTKVTVRGPETVATAAYALEYGFDDDEPSYLGIVFKPGVFMPHLLPGRVADQHTDLATQAVHREEMSDGTTYRTASPRTAAA